MGGIHIIDKSLTKQFCHMIFYILQLSLHKMQHRKNRWMHLFKSDNVALR